METKPTLTVLAVPLDLSADQVEQRLIDITDEAEVLRHLLKGLRSRDKVRHIRGRMQQVGVQSDD